MAESAQAHGGDPQRPAPPALRSPQAHGGDPQRPAPPALRSPQAHGGDPQRQPDRPGESDPGRGRRLGVDVGTVRIGVAVSDPDGILAVPVETVPRDRSGKHLRRLAALTSEYEAVEVIVGLPRTLADRIGRSAQDAIEVADAVAARVAPTPVRLADERLTTVSAQRSLRDAGLKAKQQRSVIDQAAAVAILQDWLDQRRALIAHPAGNEASDV